MRLRIDILLALIFTTIMSSINYVNSQTIQVRLFSSISFDSASIKVNTGSYSLTSGNDTIARLETGNTITVCTKKKKGKVQVRGQKVSTGSYTSLQLKGNSFRNSLSIRPHNVKVAIRIYDDDLLIKNSKEKLFIINKVDIENYIAGVIEAEAGGCSDNEEFFKAQALISRTYAIGHLNNHKTEGYNLCDDIHCQAYKGRAGKTSIMKAAFSTRGSVITDLKGNLITAAYHSNSGGQTVNSGDLWREQLPYLVSIADSFSIAGTKAIWEHKIKAVEWLSFLNREFNYPVNDSVAKAYALNFSQDSVRKVIFDKGITLRSIREKLGLRSTWFSVLTSGDDIILSGRGFGHGVGLSQQGAIIMADKGYSYIDILNFYYKDIQIVKRGTGNP